MHRGWEREWRSAKTVVYRNGTHHPLYTLEMDCPQSTVSVWMGEKVVERSWMIRQSSMSGGLLVNGGTLSLVMIPALSWTA